MIKAQALPKIQKKSYTDVMADESIKRIKNTEQPQLFVPADKRGGVYSNAVGIAKNNNEVTIDFAYLNINDQPNGIVNARVIMTQEHARSVAKKLQDVMNMEI